MTQGYPPYNNRESNQQPPPYHNPGQWQGQYPPPNGQQPPYQSPPTSGSYYPPEKQEYYPPGPQQPPYEAGNQSTYPPYPPQGSNYSQQPPYGYPQPSYGPPSHSPQPPYGGPPPHSPQPQYSQPGYPPQPRYGQQPPQVPYSSYPGASAPPSEDERGIMGALGGAAAGGFAGHKMGNHGIIGALGGAFAGHKLEDAYKHHNQKPSPSASPQPPMYQQQQYQAPPPQPQYSVGGLELRGNFSSSCTSITLDGDYDLIASCSVPGGGSKLSSVSLNQYITNDDGNFRWVSGGGNFAASARNVRLVENGTVLEADLADRNGRWNHAKTWLNEKIANHNGELKYVG